MQQYSRVFGAQSHSIITNGHVNQYHKSTHKTSLPTQASNAMCSQLSNLKDSEKTTVNTHKLSTKNAVYAPP